jgi:G:T/U mismatch-specific DNA glycosylase
MLRGLAPAVRGDCRLLVLGSFPSVASLQAQQYYAHPRNQFWPIVGDLFGLELMQRPYAQRIEAVCERGLGIWDVYAHCRREGSLDSAIADALPNDLPARGASAFAATHRAQRGRIGPRHAHHPQPRPRGAPSASTSPANASWSLERKRAAWREAFIAANLI